MCMFVLKNFAVRTLLLFTWRYLKRSLIGDFNILGEYKVNVLTHSMLVKIKVFISFCFNFFGIIISFTRDNNLYLRHCRTTSALRWAVSKAEFLARTSLSKLWHRIHFCVRTCVRVCVCKTILELTALEALLHQPFSVKILHKIRH